MDRKTNKQTDKRETRKKNPKETYIDGQVDILIPQKVSVGH